MKKKIERTKKNTKCFFEWCQKNRSKSTNSGRSIYCNSHRQRATINTFLSSLHRGMKRRVEGKNSHNRGNWKGKPLLPRDIFMTWAKNHPDFLSLYKRYIMNKFDRKLAPSINRIDSNKGYTLDNIEWMTSSQNSGLAGTVKKMNNREKKVIYQVLGVKQ